MFLDTSASLGCVLTNSALLFSKQKYSTSGISLSVCETIDVII